MIVRDELARWRWRTLALVVAASVLLEGFVMARAAPGGLGD